METTGFWKTDTAATANRKKTSSGETRWDLFRRATMCCCLKHWYPISSTLGLSTDFTHFWKWAFYGAGQYMPVFCHWMAHFFGKKWIYLVNCCVLVTCSLPRYYSFEVLVVSSSMMFFLVLAGVVVSPLFCFVCATGRSIPRNARFPLQLSGLSAGSYAVRIDQHVQGGLRQSSSIVQTVLGESSTAREQTHSFSCVY